MNGKELEQLAQTKNYQNLYEQKESIGQGGFAKVFKVVNKMDKNEYAMKIINVNLKDIRKNIDFELNKITRESRHLASLSHPSIIRYYNSWLEVGKKKKSRQQSPNNRQKEQPQQSSGKKKKQIIYDYNDTDSVENDFYFEFENVGEQDDQIFFVKDNEDEKALKQEIMNKKSGSVYIVQEDDDVLNNDDISTNSVDNNEERMNNQDIDEFMSPLRMSKKQSTPVKNQSQKSSNFREEVKNNLKKNQSEKKPKNLQQELEEKQAQEENENHFSKSEQYGLQRRNSLSSLEKKQCFDEYENIILYIQTELCDSNLDKYLQERNEKIMKLGEMNVVEIREIWEQSYEILAQILDGLDYIHNVCKLVHRDLKPHNIFLKGENRQVKIGDFGLVKKINRLIHLQQYDSDEIVNRTKKLSLDMTNLAKNNSKQQKKSAKKVNQNWPIHLPKNNIQDIDEICNDFEQQLITKNCGTQTYASPEQINADLEAFDQRADIYSLGIIMLQVLNPHNTIMELCTVIHNSKKCKELPQDLRAKHPHLATQILKCLEMDPKNRPSIKQIQEALRRDRLANMMVIKRKKSNDAQSFPCSYLLENHPTPLANKIIKVLDNEILFFHQNHAKAEYVYDLKECEIQTLTSNSQITLKHTMMNNITIIFESPKDFNKVSVLLEADNQIFEMPEPIQETNSEWIMEIIE